MIETLDSTAPRRSFVTRFTPSLSVVCAAAAALLTMGWRFLTFTGFNNDHYIYLAGAQQIVLGEWPVRDFVDPGWPLMYVVPAIARALFGRELWVELLVVSSAFAVASAFTLAAASRLSVSLILASLVTLLEIAVNPRSFGYPKLLLYAAAGWAFAAATRRMTDRRAVALAALSAAAFLFRHDHGIYIGAGAFAAVALGSADEGAKAIVRRTAVFAAAALLLMLPWVSFVQYHVGLIDYFRPALEFSRAEAEGTLLRSLPWFDPAAGFAARVNAEVWLFYAFYAIPLASLWQAWSRARDGRQRASGESAAVAAIAVMAITMNVGFIRTPLSARLPDAAAPAAILGAWLLGNAFDVRATTRRRVALSAAAVIFALTVQSISLVADVPGELNRAGVLARAGAMDARIADLSRRLRRTMPEGSHVPSRNAEALQPFFDFVARCTSPRDRLVMTGLSPEVFVLANRGFAGGRMAYRPHFYDSEPEQRKTIAMIRSQSVPFVIVSLEEETGFRSSLALVASYVDEHYEAIAHIDVPDTRGLQLYVDKARRASDRDSATGWPCFAS